MKSITYIIILFAIGCLATNASAGTWTYLNGHALNISMIPNNIVIRGTDNHVYFSRYNPPTNSWEPWTSLGGTTYDEPTIAIRDNAIHVVVRGSDNGVYYKKLNLTTNTWDSKWTSLGGHTLSAPTMISTGDGLWLAVRGTDNHIYSKFVGQSGWVNWGGSTFDRPALAYVFMYLYEEFTIAIRGTDNNIYIAGNGIRCVDPPPHCDGLFSYSWTLIGGPAFSTPAIFYNGDRFYVVARGTDNHLYFRKAEEWSFLGGTTLDMPAVSFYCPDQDLLGIYVVGTNSRVYSKVLNLTSNQQSGWTDMMHTAKGHPVFSCGGTQGFLAVRGMDDGVYVYKF